MFRFKQYLLEYLTPDQEKIYSSHRMKPGARSATDHFFGVGNDRVEEDIKSYEHDKSEPHKKVEQHLGQTISHEDYKAGQIQDPKYPSRKLNIGKLITNPKLRDEFNADNTRAGKSISKPKMSIVRGVHVAGQTNPMPDALHPTGHSWSQESCKNIEDGSNSRYLNKEIRHGSVVVFGHDHDGKEIYRATLHPHHDEEHTHTVYAIDSEYGIKHPSFTAHAKDVAKRLSAKAPKDLSYTKNPHVYNDNGVLRISHPDADSVHLSKLMKSTDSEVRAAAVKHPNANHDILSQAMKDEDYTVRAAAVFEHPNANHDILSQAMKDIHPMVREHAVRHPNADHDILSQGMKDENYGVRGAAVSHPNASHEMLSQAMKDEHTYVRTAALRHPNANHEILSQGMKDESLLVQDIAQRTAAGRISRNSANK